MHEIQKAEYWRSPSSFISFYLRDIPAEETSISRAALSARAWKQERYYLLASIHASQLLLCCRSKFEQIDGRMYRQYINRIRTNPLISTKYIQPPICESPAIPAPGRATSHGYQWILARSGKGRWWVRSWRIMGLLIRDIAILNR